MGVFQRLMGLAGFPIDDEPARMVEAAGVTVDDDDDQWRRLTGDLDRDLEPITAERARKLARFAWESNLLANRLIELPLAYLIAEGVSLRVGAEYTDAQELLDLHWHDPINAWDLKLRRRLRELSLFGEWLSVAFTAPNGFVRWGYLDPNQIETIVTDPDNREQPIGIVTRKDRKGRAKRYRVIVAGDDAELFTRRTQEIRQTFTDGELYYATVNSLCGGVRGRSDLLAQVDWLDAYDQFLFGELDRAQFLRAWVWDVTLTGADETKVKERAKQIAAPRPGTVRVHNETEAWEAKSPELQAADSSAAARLFRTHMLGGATMPDHWFGDASQVNKSTGDSMAEPTLKMLTARQREAGHHIADMARFVLIQARRAKQITLGAKEFARLLMSVQVEWPDLASKDASRYAAALGQVVAGALAAVVGGLITRATAVRLVQSIANGLGVEFDADKELEAASEAATKEAEDDSFVPDPAAMDDEPGAMDDPAP